MSAGPIPMFRNCVHGVWQLSRGGKLIKRNTSGECGKTYQLQLIAMRAVSSPAMQVLTTKRPIWPGDRANRCPLYQHKVQTP